MRHPNKVAHIFATLSAELPMPITAKIRLGWDQDELNYMEIAHILQDNGASLIAVHARTREQFYRDPANWDAIAEIKEAMRIPVLGNGGINCVADIARMQAHTRCDGVMIGRRAIGHPWIFQRRDQKDVPLKERSAIILRHLDLMIEFYGTRISLLCIRKHITRYIRGLPNAAKARPLLITSTTRAELIKNLAFLHPR